jgi:hypothetical protein
MSVPSGSLADQSDFHITSITSHPIDQGFGMKDNCTGKDPCNVQSSGSMVVFEMEDEQNVKLMY